MKTKKFQKKLDLNKCTITNLEKVVMDESMGGSPQTWQYTVCVSCTDCTVPFTSTCDVCATPALTC